MKARKRSKAAGSPVGQPSYTNNELRSFLAKEQDRLGIKQIVPNAPRSNDPWEGIPDRPMSKDEAQAAMRRVTRRITEVNRGARAANRPAISLEGLTPSLLGSQATSKPLGLASAARRQRGSAMTSRMDIVSVPGSKAVVLKDHAETFLEEGQKMDKVQGKREYTEAEGRKFAKSQQEIKNRRGYAYASPKPIPVKDMKKEQGLEDMSGLSPMPLGRSWGDETGGLGTAGGAVLTDPKDFADLWDRLGRTEAMPSVDFEKEMVIAVFAQRSDSRRHIEIVSVAKQGGRIVIRYRVTPVANRKGPSAPYHVVTVERSAYPFSFVQVP
ncbi:MAG: hypothetical protein COB53_05625 [Elusimicrobia bacterium]|nr:MAG: hypothetical protein COB53_05625 [Elusimicrobiota bacterium]